MKRAKIWCYLIVYQNPNCDDATDSFNYNVFEYAESQLEKMNLPEGWRSLGSYEQFLQYCDTYKIK